eukprot:6593570-Pyramimonas_sp.AAC.1
MSVPSSGVQSECAKHVCLTRPRGRRNNMPMLCCPPRRRVQAQHLVHPFCDTSFPERYGQRRPATEDTL